jgi:hypothetical protein
VSQPASAVRGDCRGQRLVPAEELHTLGDRSKDTQSPTSRFRVVSDHALAPMAPGGAALGG